MSISLLRRRPEADGAGEIHTIDDRVHYESGDPQHSDENIGGQTDTVIKLLLRLAMVHVSRTYIEPSVLGSRQGFTRPWRPKDREERYLGIQAYCFAHAGRPGLLASTISP